MNFVVWRGVQEPVSSQIARQLAREIRAGRWEPGERLPSVRELKVSIGVAFNTILRAYAELVRSGLAYSVPGRGVYVSPNALGMMHPDPPEHERRRFLALADALLAQAERCGYGLDDALSEVRLRGAIRRRKAAAAKGTRKGRT
jgi:DNA-binding transcriptional regulator YhcF (GntR family)